MFPMIEVLTNTGALNGGGGVSGKGAVLPMFVLRKNQPPSLDHDTVTDR